MSDIALLPRSKCRAKSLPQESQNTVLPTPIAALVSYGTATASFSLRLGGFFTNAAIQGAKITTLTGFELGRAVIESVLLRAGTDVIQISGGPFGKAAAETLLERALSSLHYTITKTSFLVSAGFQLGSSTVESSLAVSQYVLSAIDSILGDTATSKAVATIIVLVRREFENPETGLPGERIGLGDLLVGSIAFALLQRWGKDKTYQDFIAAGGEETIWNLVVLHDDNTYAESPTSSDDELALLEAETEQSRPVRRARRVSSISGTGSIDISVADDNASMFSNLSSKPTSWGVDGSRSEAAFGRYLTNQLQPGTSVSVTALSVVTSTIAVTVYGSDVPSLDPPPGYAIVSVEEQRHTKGGAKKIIFQKRQKRLRRGSFETDDLSNSNRLSWPGSQPAEISELWRPLSSVPKDDDQQHAYVPSETGPRQSARNSMELNRPENRPLILPLSNAYRPERTPSPTLLSATPALANQKRQRVPPITQTNFPIERSEKKGGFAAPLRRGTSYKNLVDFWSSGRRSGKTTPPSKIATSPGQDAGLNITSGIRRSDSLPGFQFPADQNFGQMDDSAQVETGFDSFGESLAPKSPLVRSDSSVSQRSNHARDNSTADATYAQSLRRWRDPHTVHSRPSSRRSRASFYTLPAANSETSLVLLNKHALTEVAGSLYRDGLMSGTFPKRHFLQNLFRFSRFALASYGSSFLRFFGADSTNAVQVPPDVLQVAEHHSFSTYARLPASTVLLSSYVDPEGGFDAKGHTETGMPLVHYIVLDHDSKAVVLTCRGTLGFEDVLTDMICDYDDLIFCNQKYQVHKGMHASARRLLTMHGGRVLATIKAALEEFEDYGLVLCGHSMGGGVASLAAFYLAQPNTVDPSTSPFVTASQSHRALPMSFPLPPNRPIHVYAYGPPATVSSYLRRATRGLITTVVHGQDVVPYLSLGTLRDFQAVALAFKVDTQDAKGEVKRRVWNGLKSAFRDKSGLGNIGGLKSDFDSTLPPQFGGDVDHWPWVALKSLRAGMLSEKLCPPGEAFIVETQSVLQRFAFVQEEKNMPDQVSFKPADRATLRIVHQPEIRFGELQFGASMFADHSPARYEKALRILTKGVCGTE